MGSSPTVLSPYVLCGYIEKLLLFYVDVGTLLKVNIDLRVFWRNLLWPLNDRSTSTNADDSASSFPVVPCTCFVSVSLLAKNASILLTKLK